MRQLDELVGEHPFFAGLAPQYLSFIAGCGKLSAFQPGEYLAREGTPANSFYLVRHGRVALEITPPGKDPFLVSSASEGEMIGWSWLFEPYQWQFSARAMDRVGVIEFDGKCLRGKCDEDPVLGYDLMKRFARVMVQRFVDSRLQFMDVYGKPR